MTTEALAVTTTVPAPADAVFAVLADPTGHAAIDGTGWVCEPLDGERLTKSAQVFRTGGGEFVRIDLPIHLRSTVVLVNTGLSDERSGMRLLNIHSGSAAMGAEERLRATR